VKKNIFILFGCFLFAFSSAQPLEVWVRDAEGKVEKKADISSFSDLLSLTNFGAVCKLVVEEGDDPFQYPKPFTHLKPRCENIGFMKNLESLVFRGVEFFPEGGFLEERVPSYSPTNPRLSHIPETFQRKPTLGYLKKLSMLRILCFENCGINGKEEQLRGLLEKEGIDFSKITSLRRVVAVDGEDEGRVEIDLYARPAAVGIWQNFLRLPGVNLFAKLIDLIRMRTAIFFPLAGRSPRGVPSREIPKVWKVTFLGFKGLYGKGEGFYIKDRWDRFFTRYPSASNARGINHVTIDGGTLYWVNFWHHFPNVRTIMLRNLEPIPKASGSVDAINWDGVKFPPMLEEVRIERRTIDERETIGDDEIKELREHLSAEVRLTVNGEIVV